MKFIEINNYFYKQFSREFFGIPDKDKRNHYEKLCINGISQKAELRNRIKTYYENINTQDINHFYEEMVDLFHVYEGNYLLENILLEKNNVLILQSLFKKNIINDDNTKFFSYDINTFLVKALNKFKLNSFKLSNDNLIEILIYILNNKINYGKSDSNTVYLNIDNLYKIYPNWLIQSLEQELQINSYFIFCITWRLKHSDDNFSYQILLLHEILNQIKKYPNFNIIKFHKLSEKNFSQYFVGDTFIPLFNDSKSLSYPNGYFLKKSEILKIVYNLNELELAISNENINQLFSFYNSGQYEYEFGLFENYIYSAINKWVMNKYKTDDERKNIKQELNNESKSKDLLIKIIKSNYYFAFYDFIDFKYNLKSYINSDKIYSTNLEENRKNILSVVAEKYKVSSTYLINLLIRKGVSKHKLSNNTELSIYMLGILENEFPHLKSIKNTSVQSESTSILLQKQRHTDKDLQEFNDNIINKMNLLKGEIIFDIKNYQNNKGNKILKRKLNRKKLDYTKLQDALYLIKLKEYGICVNTGKLIDKETLLKNPLTRSI